MISVITSQNLKYFPRAMETMLRDRKTIFVDQLGWDIPVVRDLYEMDEFDDQHAIYLVAIDEANGSHRGSMRLLPTTRPHILGTLFPYLCEGEVPTGSDIWEVTRFCVSPSITDPQEVKQIRRDLGLALTEFALIYDITKVTACMHASWLSALMAVGWDARPLGFLQDVAGEQTGAMEIDLDRQTLRILRARAGRRLPVLSWQAFEQEAA